MKDERGDAAENSGQNTSRGCPESLRPYQWKKGQPSPNPGGRPKKTPLTDAYAQLVQAALPEEIRSRLRLPKGAKWADAIALCLVRSVLKGNCLAAKEIADRVEGRVRVPVEVETPEGQEIRVEIVHIGGSEEPKDDSKQAGSQNSAAIKPESR